MAVASYGSGYGPPGSYGTGYGPPSSYGPPVSHSCAYGPTGGYGPYPPAGDYGSPPPALEYAPHPPAADYGHAPPPAPADYGHAPPPAGSWGGGSGPPADYSAAGYGYGIASSYGSGPCYGGSYGSHCYGGYGGYGAGPDYGASYGSGYAAPGFYGPPPGYGYCGAPPAHGAPPAYGAPPGYGPVSSSGSPRGPPSSREGRASGAGRARQEGGRKRASSRLGREGGEAHKCAKASSSAGGGRKSSDRTSSDPPASDNLYIMGLPAGMTNEALKQLFAEHGKVSQCRVLTNPSGEGKCAALVRFESAAEAKLVKEKLNGSVPDGLQDPVSVRFADSPETKVTKVSGDAKGNGKGPAVVVGIDALTASFEMNGALPGTRSHESNQHALYIAGLPPDTANVHLYKLFASFGAIRPKGVHTMMNPDGTCKGIAFVNFLDEAAAQAAILMYNGAVLPDGTTLKVAMKQSKGDAAKGATPKTAPPTNTA